MTFAATFVVPVQWAVAVAIFGHLSDRFAYLVLTQRNYTLIEYARWQQYYTYNNKIQY